MQNKTKFRVYYSGNSTRFKGFEEEVYATNERAAVLKVCDDLIELYSQDNGDITDCDAEVVNKADWDYVKYDGGSFSAEEIV